MEENANDRNRSSGGRRGEISENLPPKVKSIFPPPSPCGPVGKKLFSVDLQTHKRRGYATERALTLLSPPFLHAIRSEHYYR
ncbi:hypothetical protein TNCV_223671 [Trichonephila clavipes]|nr:hypothetical protein TNCV_223671 [Trichonephila clavipes]